MHPPTARTALYYDDDAYVETRRPATAGEQTGVMGRRVAGKEFLSAYLAHGTWSTLTAIVPDDRSRRSLYQACQLHPSSRSQQRRLKILEVERFLTDFAGDPPADILHLPCPPDARFAWAREYLGYPAFALSGVTHTLCSAAAVAALRDLLIAPFEPYDRLICTSRSVVDMVHATCDAFGQYLGDRFGSTVQRRIALELIPLGVDIERFRAPHPNERVNERARLKIAEEEVAVLFVGRLAHHAKAHPFPMFHALAEAARRTQRRVHLLLAGWAATPAVLDAFRRGAKQFAPQVRTTFLDGNQADVRQAVWRAADIFTSLSDNIQETFGLVIVEAMASGLPVVASDWNGYRDLVVSGQTGYLVPTYTVSGAMESLTAQLLFGEVNYDHFLARSNQCVAVDTASTVEAFVRLIEDVELRQRMGKAGRQRACEQFAWQHVVRAYEAIWNCQAEELAAHRARCKRRSLGEVQTDHAMSRPTAPSSYVPLDVSFATYPTRRLEDVDMVYSRPDAVQQLPIIASTPLTNYEATGRCGKLPLLTAVLDQSQGGCTIQSLDDLLRQQGYSRSQARATLAWLLKYDLLRVAVLK